MSPWRVNQALRTPGVKNGIFARDSFRASLRLQKIGGNLQPMLQSRDKPSLHQSLLYSMSGSGRIYGVGGTQDNGCLSPTHHQPVPTVVSSRACSTVGKVSTRDFQALFSHGHLRPGLTPHPLWLSSSLWYSPQTLQGEDRFSNQKRKERRQLSNILCLACSKDSSCCSHQPLGNIWRVAGAQNLGPGGLDKLSLVIFPWSAKINNDK